MDLQKNDNLIAAIVVSSLIIGGSLMFLGARIGISPSDLKAEIRLGIEDYVKEAQEASSKPSIEITEENLVDDDPYSGSVDAPVTIVEFSDFQCPVCEAYFSDVYGLIKENYVATGKVKYVFRDFPLSMHPSAYPAALAANCVRDQKGDETYFAMHDALFENQEMLSADDETVKAGLSSLAESFGVDMDKYTECYESDKFLEEISADFSYGRSAAIDGTPSFYINGTLYKGYMPYEKFVEIIEGAM